MHPNPFSSKFRTSPGEVCTVIDEGVLNTDSAADLRRWLLRQCELVSVVRLPEVTFKPNKINVRSSVLHLRRRAHEDVDGEADYDVTYLDIGSLGYHGSGDPIRGFDEASMMAAIQQHLETNKNSSKGEHWSAFKVSIANIVADKTCRLDLKYWDADVILGIKKLVSNKHKTLSDIAVKEIRRGESPEAESYVDEKDGYALVVKAGTNISKYGELIEQGDFVEKVVYQEMESCWLKDGDVLLASTGSGTLGKCCVFRSLRPAIADGHVTIIRLNQKKVLPEFVCDYLRLGFGAIQVQRLFTGSTGLIELTAEQVSSIVIALPSTLTEQMRISKKLRTAEAKYRSAISVAGKALDAQKRAFFVDLPIRSLPPAVLEETAEVETEPSEQLTNQALAAVTRGLSSAKFGSYKPGPAGIVRDRSKGGRRGKAPKFKGRRKPR